MGRTPCNKSVSMTFIKFARRPPHYELCILHYELTVSLVPKS